MLLLLLLLLLVVVVVDFLIERSGDAACVVNLFCFLALARIAVAALSLNAIASCSRFGVAGSLNTAAASVDIHHTPHTHTHTHTRQ
jgi:NADH:ubiquinone oxidoreductase subunit H